MKHHYTVAQNTFLREKNENEGKTKTNKKMMKLMKIWKKSCLINFDLLFS
jgi:hypothetical protein